MYPFITSVRRVCRSLGFDLVRLGQPDDFIKVRNQCLLEVSDVVDAGANSGQWATELRESGWAGNIHSFEPITSYYEGLKLNAKHDNTWHVYPFGLGKSDQELTIHIAANNGGSSSFLEIQPFVVDIQDSTETIGSEVALKLSIGSR